MKRRTFLTTLSLSTLGIGIATPLLFTFTKQQAPWESTIASIWEILLPKSTHMPSALEVNAIGFLRAALESEYIDSDDRDFLLEGVDEFNKQFSGFPHKSTRDRELIIKEALQDDYFEAWFSLLIYYGLEAMFSDPIYGGNLDGSIWKSVSHAIGEPRPKRPYGEKL